MHIVPPRTIRFIQQSLFILERMGTSTRHFRNYYQHYLRWSEDALSISVDASIKLILELEQEAKELVREIPKYSESDFSVDRRYPIFHDTLEVIPIYKDGVILECHRPLVSPSQIPYLLYLQKIPGYREGIDVEDHGFGYHFHYGKVKSHTIRRTNLLLTFDPTPNISQNSNVASLVKIPLYGEQHAEGKCKPIDVESIGINKRLPIYLVCFAVGEKRGFSNFKRPSRKAKIFHDAT